MFGGKQTFICSKCNSEDWVFSMFSIFKTQCIECRGITQSILNNYKQLALSGQLTLQRAENDLQNYLNRGSVNQMEANFIRSLFPMFCKQSNCPPQNSCAHDTSNYLSNSGFSELNAGRGANMRIVGGMCRCECGLVLRAKELRNWGANKGQQVNAVSNNGIYLVYQERNSDGQGHVYAVIQGNVRGNSLADNWGGWNTQQAFKIK